MIDNLEFLLDKAGLSNSERKVYLKTLGQGAISSSQAEELSRLPRSTVMAALEKLRDVGLCETLRRDGRSLTYVIRKPSALKPYLGKQAQDLGFLMESLEKVSIDEQNDKGIGARTGEGQEALQSELEFALRCKNRKWQIIAPRANALSYLPKEYIAYFKKIRDEQGISSQTLWEPGQKGQHLDVKNILMRKPRYVPDSLCKKIPGILIVFDDEVMFIQGTDKPAFIHINNPAVASMVRLVFEMAWRSVK